MACPPQVKNCPDRDMKAKNGVVSNPVPNSPSVQIIMGKTYNVTVKSR